MTFTVNSDAKFTHYSLINLIIKLEYLILITEAYTLISFIVKLEYVVISIKYTLYFN